MTSIIKPLKTKQKDGTEQVVFPNTLSEAVIDSETNKTLDVILDELNNKIDNIEPGGSGGSGGATYELGRTDDTITLTGSDGSSSEVDITPVENLLVYPYVISNETADNYTIIDNGDGTLTITCNFPELSMAYLQIVHKQPISAGTYTVSGCSEDFTDSTVGVNIYVDDTSGNRIHDGNLIYGQNFTFTITELCYLSISLRFDSGASLTDAVLKPMLELGTVAHDYKPYKDVSKANQTDIDNKVSKSGDTMTGMLTVKDNVSVEGDLFVPITPEQSILNNEQPNTNFTAPTSGGWQDDTVCLIEDLPNSKTFLGSYMGGTSEDGVSDGWHNIISVRHRNGRADGGNYGMYIRSNMTDAGSLLYNKQYKGNWQGEKVILDSINYNQYALPLSGGTVNGLTKFNGGLVSSTESTQFAQDYYCFNTAQGAGSKGYWKLCTIAVTGIYAGTVIEFDMTCRYGVGKLYLSFGGAGIGTDVSKYTVNIFKQTGGLRQCYIVKTSGTSSGSVFDLYVTKEEAYGNLTVNHMQFPQYMRGLATITWSGAHVSSLPSGATAATVTNDWSGIIKSASTSISLSLRKGFNYIIFATGSSGMSFTETIIYIPYTDTFHTLNTDASGSATSAISGTTYTLTFSGSGSSRLEYIEIGG